MRSEKLSWVPASAAGPAAAIWVGATASDLSTAGAGMVCGTAPNTAEDTAS